jgi:hypothetical protein
MSQPDRASEGIAAGLPSPHIRTSELTNVLAPFLVLLVAIVGEAAGSSRCGPNCRSLAAADQRSYGSTRSRSQVAIVSAGKRSTFAKAKLKKIAPLHFVTSLCVYSIGLVVCQLSIVG